MCGGAVVWGKRRTGGAREGEHVCGLRTETTVTSDTREGVRRIILIIPLAASLDPQEHDQPQQDVGDAA